MAFILLVAATALSAALPTGCPDFEVELPRQTGGVVVRAADFGFSETNEHNAAALTRAFAHCRAVGASRLELAPGRYYCRDAEGVMAEGLRDLTVEGQGAVLVFDRPSVFRDIDYWRVEISPDYGNFRIRNCERVRLRDFSVDWDWERDPLAAFVRVTQVHLGDRKTFDSWFEAEFVDYAAYPTAGRPLALSTLADMDENRKDFATTGTCRYLGTFEGQYASTAEWLAPNRVRVWPFKRPGGNLPVNSVMIPKLVPEANYGAVKSLKEGRLYRLAHYYVGKNCFDMLSNRHLTLEDINVHSCRGDAFHVEGRQQYWQLLRVKVCPPADPAKAGGGPRHRPMTTTLDVMHIGRSCGYAKLIGFACTLNQDDHANFHDRFSAVRKTGAKTVEITQGRGNAYFQAEVGSPIEFLNPDLSPSGFTARVAEVADDTHLVFDREIPDRFAACDAFVFDRTYGTDNILVKDCVYESCWGRFLMLGHNVTFDHCTWRKGIASAVLVQEGFCYGYWAEGFGSGNVVIRNCTFDALQRFNRPARPGGPVCDLFVGVNLDTRGRRTDKLAGVWPGLIDGVLIENNTFVDPRGAVLHVSDGTNVVFRNNRIVTTAGGNPAPLPYAGEVRVDPAAKGGVTVEGNCRLVRIPDAPFEMPAIPEHVFPSRAFSIVEYGASTNGLRCTDAFARAMSACHAAGGGRVVVPPGRWLTGAVHFRSGCELHLAEGAVLEFTDDPADYPEAFTSWEGIECYNHSPLIYAFGCTNVAITGSGTIAPRMGLWKEWFARPPEHMKATEHLYHWCSTNCPVEARRLLALDRAHMRPHLIQFNRCGNVRLDGFRIRESPFWMIHLYHSENCIVRNLETYAHGHNNDGVDIEMTKNVLVEKCHFDQGDDGIVLKAGRNADGWRLGRCTENVVVRDCDLVDSHSLLGIGSELSGGIRNVWMTRCRVENTYTMLRIKTGPRRGGFVENVWMDHCTGGKMQRVFNIFTSYCAQWGRFPDFELRRTRIRNVHVSDLEAGDVDYGIDLAGDPLLPPEHIRIRDVHVGKASKALQNVENCLDVKIENMTER